MSDMHLKQEILDSLEERLSDLDRLSAALQKKYPEFIAFGDGVGAQPCNTEFTTVGLGTQSITTTGLKAAYQQAETDAKLVCSTGKCKTAKFERYVEISRTPDKRYRVVCAWSCVNGAP